MNFSPKFSVDGADIVSILKGLGIAVGGAVVTALSMLAGAHYNLTVSGVDYSAITTLLVSALISMVINFIRKFIAENTVPVAASSVPPATPVVPVAPKA